ncbi:unnamed protein product, partial [Ectocarpus sp. 12 AP-2014]
TATYATFACKASRSGKARHGTDGEFTSASKLPRPAPTLVEENGKKLRCIFAADVAKGRDFVTKKTGFDGARYPPVGHDSVQG